MLPSVRRVAVMTNAADPVFAKSVLQQSHSVGSGTGTEIVDIVVRDPSDLEAAFAAAVKEKSDALVYQASLPTQRVAELAIAHRLPAATTIRAFAEAGGLMAYGADAPSLSRRAATFVDKIFRGEKPANIPVEQSTKFNLVLNLKTAKAVGVQVPPALLARADEVIE
jgi:putative ABC transport system substrate-binding protein